MSLKHRRGFTLIELLLVVTIIIILVGLLLPSYLRLRDTVATGSCSSNLNHIMQATGAYAADNDRRCPPGRQGSGTPTDPVGWVQSPWNDINSVRTGSLYTYMGRNESAYLCPKFLEVYKKWNPGNAGTTAAFSYSLNEYMGKSWQGPPPGVSAPIVKTIDGDPYPATVTLYADENAWTVPSYSNHGLNNGALGVGALWNPGSVVDAIGSFHEAPGWNYNDGSGNCLFMDGHVALRHVSLSKLVCTPTRYRPPEFVGQ